MIKIENFIKKCYANSNVFQDIMIILKIIAYTVYAYAEVLFRNVVPSVHLNKNIKGDVVCITGAAGGLGRELTKNFLKLGCVVVCIDLNDEILKNLETELTATFSREPESFRTRMYFYKLDISKLNDIKSVCAQIKKEVGKVDILVNNAGIMNGSKSLLSLNDDEISQIFNVNVFSQIWLCREFLPEMISSRKGHIVNVSSICGMAGGYKLSDYCTSKFAVNGFSESLRVELGVMSPKNQIKVTLVCPFRIKTKMFNGADINHLQWLQLNLEPARVADEIVNGVLLNKDLILIPKINYLFTIIKSLVPTKAMDYLQFQFDFHGSMDRMKKLN